MSRPAHTRLVYVSPLKALAYDVDRNLRAPLKGIGADLSVAIRTGDTPQRERAAMRRTPPDILITTPESLYLILTSQAREMLRGVESVIVDEIHAVASTKRGAHLALTLERLSELSDHEPQRIGLSATQNPLEEVGRFMVGPRRTARIVDAGIRKPLDLKIHVPVESMVEPDQSPGADLDFTAGGEATRKSIWPAIYPELLEQVRAHRSTIVFVNSRRGAERLALRLNELAGEEISRAHHGSLAREERTVVEEMLKAGELPCLIATSSLELGIDMGAVDLVLQVESPKSVARGLQRIGRAGHSVGDTSKGRIFPKFRADLLECAVVVKLMREGRIEPTVVPHNALDVLAQQIVAIAAARRRAGAGRRVDELFALVTRTHSYAELSRDLLENVLDMLDGRYPSREFGELRPRIVWDRVGGTIRARKGARQLAVTNAGTIPDRGLFSVVLPDGRRVGELDEEMVYEARAGQTFLLGASTWRIEEIGRDRVIVTPAPGVPGAVPFWKGDSVGRPKELGREIGAFSRWAVDQPAEVLERDYDLDALAARNLVDYLREQQAATRVVPSDRTIVIERFRDEIGDWRLCVLVALRRARPRRLGPGAVAAHPRGVRPRVRRDLVRRRDHRPPPRRRRAAGRRPRPRRPRRARGRRRRRAGHERAVRRALPRERRALAAHPARLPRQAHAAVAAAPEVAVAARGGAALRAVPDRPRDLPRVPARRARPAGADRAAARAAPPRDQRRRGRDPDRLALRLEPALRLRRHVHVRGRHAQRRAPRGGAVARPRAAARAARPGGAARAHRPRRAGAGRARPPAPLRPHARGLARRAGRRPAPPRRPDRRRGRRPRARGARSRRRC